MEVKFYKAWALASLFLLVTCIVWLNFFRKSELKTHFGPKEITLAGSPYLKINKFMSSDSIGFVSEADSPVQLEIHFNYNFMADSTYEVRFADMNTNGGKISFSVFDREHPENRQRMQLVNSRIEFRAPLVANNNLMIVLSYFGRGISFSGISVNKLVK